MRKIIYLLLGLIITLGCTHQGFNNFDGDQTDTVKKLYGSLEVATGNRQEKSVYIDNTRSIVISDITAAKIIVSGYGFSDLSADTTAVADGKSSSNTTITNIPVGKNRVVTVQAKNGAENISGITIRKVIDINVGGNTTSVGWSDTALGNVFYDLLTTHNYDIGSMDDTTKTNIINAINSTKTTYSITHNSMINYSAIATDVKNNTLKTAGDVTYRYVSSSATFSINDITDFTNITAQVNDPASSKLLSLTTGVNTIANIKPGNWELIISLNDGVVYRSGIKTFVSSVPYDFGAIDLLVAKPYLEPFNPFFTGNISVTIATSTAGAEVYYTTNNSEPTNIVSGTNFKYTAPFNISNTTTIKAKAFKSNYISSEVAEKTYKKQTIGYEHPSSGDFSPIDEGTWGACSWNLGAHYNGNDVEFAVYSKNATKILLEIYETETSLTNTNKGYNTDARYDYWMAKGSDDIWRAKLSNVPEKTYYAFRVWGPNWVWDDAWTRGNSSEGFISDVDANGNRFNPNKVLFDPYARELSHDKEFPAMAQAGENGGMYGTGGSETQTSSDPVQYATYSGPLTTNNVVISRRNVDTGRWVPKGVLFKPTGKTFSKPSFAEKSSVIYEAHVRGISAHESSSNLTSILSGFDGFGSVVNVPAQYRGTYKGAGYLAKYLKSIGINTIELLPVHETENDMMPFDGTVPTLGGAKNFWGYMTYGFFAPDRRYSYDKSAGGPTAEFQEMVQAFNSEGIKVFLDVVYNHTGEGGNWGHMDVTGFVSMGGFDCAEYYHLVPGGDGKNWIVDGATGCGNQLNFSRSVNHNLVIDSLTYWIEVMGMSGFRFDLAAVLGRKPDDHAWNPDTYWNDDRVKSFYSDHPTLLDIASLGSSKGAWMIAEAWDLWGYPVGMFPNGWGEWNGRYRDAVRRYLKGDPSGHDDLSYNGAFHGDYDHFNDQGGPHKSINFLVAHDGFTLSDLVCYNTKMNTTLSWPFGPSDGGNDNNDSWDSGLGGGQTDTDKQNFRRQRLRNFWTYQMFSRGTPMIVYGDELTRTQNGNNNPYNIDSIMTWNNYNMINTDSPHTVSTGSSSDYHNNLGTDTSSDSKNNLFLFATNITKLRRDSAALHADNYDEVIGYTKEDGAALSGGERAVRIWRGNYLICSNMWEADSTYTIPDPGAEYQWVRIVDTAYWAEADHNNYWSVDEGAVLSGTYGVKAWSIVVFQKVLSTAAQPTFDVPPGSYNTAKSVTISSTTPGSNIKYTKDGSDPTTSGTAITTSSPAAVNVNSSMTIKAYTIKTGLSDSSVAEAVYVIDTTPPTVSSITPTDGSTSISTSVDIVLLFNESLDNSIKGSMSFTSPSLTLNDTNCVITFSQTTNPNDTVTINPNAYFNTSTTYSNISVSGFKDVAGNEANYSNSEYDFTTVSAPTLDPPTNVSATDGTHATNVTISWTAVTGAEKYYIYRADNSAGTYSNVGNTISTSFDDAPGSVGRYYYKVTSYDTAGGESSMSSFDGGNITWTVPQNLNRTGYPYTQEVILQGFYWYIPDHNKANANSESNLYQYYKTQAANFHNDGITAIWMPPSGKAFNDGDYYNVGYAIYDHYDLGEFEQEVNQTETVKTPRVRYGTRKELVEAIDTLHGNGTKVIADIVMNHMLGSEIGSTVTVSESIPSGTTSVTAYIDFDFNRSCDSDPRKSIYSSFNWGLNHFDGMESYGNFYLFSGHSLDNVNVFDSETYFQSDIILGADVDFDNADAKGEMITWTKWLVDQLNLDGFRVDAIRHISNDFIKEWTEEMNTYMSGKDPIIFGENWDGWAKRLNAYSYNAPDNADRTFNEVSPNTYKGIGYGNGDPLNSNVMQLFDVPLHYTFQKIANGEKDMTALLDDWTTGHLGDNALVKAKPTQAITFVDNHDTVPAQALESYIPYSFKLQAYAFILLYNGGTPCVYYEDMYKGNAKYTTDNEGKTWNDASKYDYSTELNTGIKELIAARHNYAYGDGRNPSSPQGDAANFWSYTREGKDGKDLVVIIAKPGQTGTTWIDPYDAGATKTFNLVAGDGNGVTSIETNSSGWGGFSVGAEGYSVWVEQ